jgi:predicted AAA+ superfamily ATPase
MAAKPALYHWRTSGGAEVYIVLDYNRKLYPVEIKAKTNLTRHDAGGVTAFLQTYPSDADTGIIIYAGSEMYQVKENIWAMSWDSI